MLGANTSPAALSPTCCQLLTSHLSLGRQLPLDEIKNDTLSRSETDTFKKIDNNCATVLMAPFVFICCSLTIHLFYDS